MTSGFLSGFRNFCKLPWVCLVKFFVFARIRLDPLGGWVLNHDCISVIVSRLAIVAKDLVICCCQFTKIYSSRFGFAIASSARGPCNFGPFTDLVISVFREIRKILCLPKSSRLFAVGSKEASWDELAWESPWTGILSSTKLSLNSCSHSGISESDGFPSSIVVSSGSSDLSPTEVDTCTGEMSLLFPSSRSRVWISPTVGEEDEDEEDEEEQLSCFEGVFKVDDDPDDELDTPGTTTGTKFSVLQGIRIPFWWDVVFDHWSIRGNTRFHRRIFQATLLLVCFRGLSLSRIHQILQHTQFASSCVCTSSLAVMTIVGLHDFVKVSISASLKSFLLIICIDAPESTTNSRLTFRRILCQFLVTSLPRFPRSIVTFIGDRFSFLPISLFQCNHSTFVLVRFRPSHRLFINLTMWDWALYPKPTTILVFVAPAFWRMPFFYKLSCCRFL